MIFRMWKDRSIPQIFQNDRFRQLFQNLYQTAVSSYDFTREGQGTQSTWESSPFRSEMFHLLNEESSLLNKIMFLKRYLDLLH